MIDTYELIVVIEQLRRLLEEDRDSIEVALQGELADAYRTLLDMELQEVGRIETTLRYSMGPPFEMR